MRWDQVPVTLEVGVATDAGRVRSGNEDSFFVSSFGNGSPESGTAPIALDARLGVILAVCDGMGGALAGEVASQVATDTLRARAIELVVDAVDSADSLLDWLESAVREANDRVRTRSVLDPDLEGMGSTMTCTAALGSTLAIVHVGDSRLYLLRGGTLRQLSMDQTLVSWMVENGDLTPEQAQQHESRHVLLQAVGVRDELDVQRFWLSLQQGDRLLLCTDGLYDLVSDEQIASVLQEGTSPEEQARHLIARANASGGLDNVTAVVARVAMKPPGTNIAGADS